MYKRPSQHPKIEVPGQLSFESDRADEGNMMGKFQRPSTAKATRGGRMTYPAEKLKIKAKRASVNPGSDLIDPPRPLSGGAIYQGSGKEKRRRIPPAPKGFPKKLIPWVKKHVHLAKHIAEKVQGLKGSGLRMAGGGLSDAGSRLLSGILDSIKSTLRTKAQELFMYAINNPVETLAWIMTIYAIFKDETSPDSYMTDKGDLDIEPIKITDADFSEDLQGTGIKKTARRTYKKTKKLARDVGKIYRTAPSQPILASADILGTAAAIPSPLSPELALASTLAKTTGKALKYAGKGQGTSIPGGRMKKAPSAYNSFVSAQMKQGKTMKEAAMLWRQQK